jgi:hypothetical protein
VDVEGGRQNDLETVRPGAVSSRGTCRVPGQPYITEAVQCSLSGIRRAITFDNVLPRRDLGSYRILISCTHSLIVNYPGGTGVMNVAAGSAGRTKHRSLRSAQ